MEIWCEMKRQLVFFWPFAKVILHTVCLICDTLHLGIAVHGCYADMHTAPTEWRPGQLSAVGCQMLVVSSPLSVLGFLLVFAVSETLGRVLVGWRTVALAGLALSDGPCLFVGPDRNFLDEHEKVHKNAGLLVLPFSRHFPPLFLYFRHPSTRFHLIFFLSFFPTLFYLFPSLSRIHFTDAHTLFCHSSPVVRKQLLVHSTSSQQQPERHSRLKQPQCLMKRLPTRTQCIR